MSRAYNNFRRPSSSCGFVGKGGGMPRSFKLAIRDAFFGSSGVEPPLITEDGFSSDNDVGAGLYDEFVNGIRNWWRGTTGSGLTERDKQLNDMNMQNVEDTAAAQTRGYLKAGINPALMYGSGGQQTAPQSSAVGTGSLSDLMQALMIPSQIKLMNAQAKNTEANTQKQISETEQIKQVMQFYPRLTEHTIAEITSRTGLNLTNISKSEAEIAIAEFEKIIKSNEAKYSDEYFRLRNRVEEASELNQKASALDAYMKALWTEYETDYTKKHDGARPSSSSLLALADAIMSWLDIDPNDTGSKLVSTVTQAVSDITHDDVESPAFTPFFREDVEPWRIKGKTIVEHGKSLWNRFKKGFSLK